MTHEKPDSTNSLLSRRAVARGAAWSVPALAVGATAPAFAASAFSCPSASCYSVLLGAGTVAVAGTPQPASSDATIAMIGATVTFNCATQYGIFGGWSVFADTVYVTTTDAGTIKANFAVTIPQPSPLAIPITIPATGFTVPGWPWDSANDGLLNVGQTTAHHITQICIQYTAIFYGIGVPLVELGRCRFQVCYTTSPVTNWNTVALTAGPATPL